MWARIKLINGITMLNKRVGGHLSDEALAKVEQRRRAGADSFVPNFTIFHFINILLIVVL